MISEVISTGVTYVIVMAKDPDLSAMEGEVGFEIQKWRLYKGLACSSGEKKSGFGLKSVW